MVNMGRGLHKHRTDDEERDPAAPQPDELRKAPHGDTKADEGEYQAQKAAPDADGKRAEDDAEVTLGAEQRIRCREGSGR